MFSFDSGVNTAVNLMVVGTDSGLSSPPDLAFFVNGVSTTLTSTCTNPYGQLYNLSFTPTSTGVYTVYCFGDLQAQVNVVTSSIYSLLQNIEDEALGSWQWDKTAGTLMLLRQDGTNLASFNMLDDLTQASRELVI